MKSGRLIFWSLLLIVLAIGCKKENQFTIKGKITHAEGQLIYLDELMISNTKLIDSTKINSRGEFKFKGKTHMPAYYLLRFSPVKFITLLVDSTESVTVNADYANFENNYLVEGSVGSSLVKDLTLHLNTTRRKIDSLTHLYTIYKEKDGFDVKKAELDLEYNKLIKNQIEYSNKFVMDHPFSMASIYALYQKFDPDDQGYIITDLQPMRVAASALNSVYPKSPHVKILYANTLQIVRNYQNAKMKKFIEENGENSPDITLPDPYGKQYSLSSLKGKVVLLQFWAGANQGSRVMNPVLVELYQKYKNRGFEIYQVGLDTDRNAWVDAIDQDKLKWINVNDLKGCNQAVNAYNVRAVPFNYLLDKQGVIVGTNLQGPELNTALSNLLK